MAGHPTAVPTAPTRRYVLGAGRVYIAPLQADGTPGGERYLGASPGFALNVTSEHTRLFDDDGPIAEKVVQVVRQVAHSFSLQCKNVSAANLALFVGGDVVSQVDSAASMDGAQADATARDRIVVDAKDRFYKLGIYPVGTSSPARTAKPAGVRAVSSTPADTVVSTDHPATVPNTLDAGTDYVVDWPHGRLYIPATSTIADGATIYVTYKPVAGTVPRVDFSDPKQVRGALRYIEDSANKNVPAGNYGWEMYAPLCTIAPSGEMAVKSRENPQVIGLDVAIQEPTSGPSFIMLQQAA